MNLTEQLVDEIQEINPWMKKTQNLNNFINPQYLPRLQEATLLNSEWDNFCTTLVGPRRSGKTTLGFYLCSQLIEKNRFKSLLHLNCDYPHLRAALTSSVLITHLINYFQLEKPVVFIDEVQRTENPGLTLKTIIDLKLPIKLIASGSSQLEIKSKVQEHITGREFESVVLPLSIQETNSDIIDQLLIYGCYPQIVQSTNKRQLLSLLYQRYINKDIIEILKINKPQVIEKLITLLSHCVGQLVQYQQLAADCNVSIPTIQAYLNILEKTYIIYKVTPFIGNKRTEITSNPIYYFIDNGFRNQAVRQFTDLETRQDTGLLVENFVFQEILKFKTQNFRDFDIHYWRTKAQAEVDFVIYQNQSHFIPIEVKYRTSIDAKIPRAYRSFLQAYQPTIGIIITKSLIAEKIFENCTVHFIPLTKLSLMLDLLAENLV